MSLLEEEIVVLAKFRDKYQWFVSERDYWVLDQDSWRRAFAEAGYGDDDSYDGRFGIPIVNEKNAGEFLELMQKYAVDMNVLRVAQAPDGGMAYPSLFVDFDERHVEIHGVESPAFEDYLPPEWTADIGLLLDKVPQNLRFWTS